MINIMSKTLSDYYGNNPDEYYIKFIHHNIIVSDENKDEYKIISEDFKNIYDLDNATFLLYFSDVENYNEIVNNIDLTPYRDKIYLRIRNIDEYDKFIKIEKNNDIKIIVDISDIEELDIKDLNLVIQIDKVSELSIDKLNSLLEKYNIKEILLGQIPYISKDYEYLYDIMSKMYNIDSSNKLQLEKINKITNDIYSVNEYREILTRFNDIINELSIKDKLDGFYKVFDYILRNVSYDDNGVATTKVENQNLIGPVFNKKAVCEGYSKCLQQMLSLVGIDSIVVQGGGSKEEGGHVWNQVLIDNKWYNADVTAASYYFNHNEEIKTCLVKDDALLYRADTSISYVCDENY